MVGDRTLNEYEVLAHVGIVVPLPPAIRAMSSNHQALIHLAFMTWPTVRERVGRRKSL